MRRHFILFDHDKVLAHRLLIDPSRFKLTEDKPLPTIQQLGDPVLAHIWDPPIHSPTIDRALGALGHVVEADGHRWVFVYRELRGYGPRPWLVGQYFPIEDATADLDKLMNGAIVGAATLAVALGAGHPDGLPHGALDPHHHHRRRGDRAAGVRPADAQALAAARDRRCRRQPRQGAQRAALVRPLRAAAPGAPPDGPRRGRRRLAPHRSHRDVHRHRRASRRRPSTCPSTRRRRCSTTTSPCSAPASSARAASSTSTSAIR